MVVAVVVVNWLTNSRKKNELDKKWKYYAIYTHIAKACDLDLLSLTLSVSFWSIRKSLQTNTNTHTHAHNKLKCLILLIPFMGIEKYVYSNFDIVTVQRSAITPMYTHGTHTHTHILMAQWTLNEARHSTTLHVKHINKFFVNPIAKKEANLMNNNSNINIDNSKNSHVISPFAWNFGKLYTYISIESKSKNFHQKQYDNKLGYFQQKQVYF